MSDDARLFALNIVDHPVAGSQVGVIAKRTYQVQGGLCRVADQQVPLATEPLLADDGATLLQDIDVILNRTTTDVIVLGHARPPQGASQFEIRVQVGRLERVLRVTGPRRCWLSAAGRVQFTDPEVVESVPLGWQSAYGGVDRVAVATREDPARAHADEAGPPYDPRYGAFAYPRNRLGKGYLIEATKEALAASALPELEEPAALLTPEGLAIGRPEWWPGGPAVAGLGFLPYDTFPRAAMLGLTPPFDDARFPPGDFREVRAGALPVRSIAADSGLPKRMDIGVAQQSAVGMRIAELQPGSAAKLTNVHPRLAEWAFSLPAEVPRMAVEIPGEALAALTPKIRTLLIEPDLDRVSVVWVGEHQVPVPIGPGKAAKIRMAARWS